MTDPSRPTPDAEPASLRTRENRFAAIFESASHFMGLLAPDGALLEANRAALEFAGASRGDVVGRPFWETAWWSDDADKQRRLREAIGEAAAGTPVRFDTEHTSATGDVWAIDFTLRPIRDETGEVRWLVAEGRDVTEARRAEEALRVSEAKFAGIVDISSDAVVSVDERQRILHFNKGAEKIFGYTAEEVVGRPLDLLLPQRFQAAHHEHVRAFGRSPVEARRMGERREIAGRRKDGDEFPADASISKLDIGGQRIFTAVLRDISDRKRAEQAQELLARAGALLASSLDYAQTLRSVVELAVPTLGDWCVVYIGEPGGPAQRLQMEHADPELAPRLAELDRFPVVPGSGHPVLPVIESGRPELIPVVDEERLEAMASGPEHRELMRALGMRSALLVPLVARGASLGGVGFYRGAAGRRYDADDLALAQDVALRAALAVDNARLYQEARQAIRARDDVLAVASHDLGNSLAAIRIGTGLLLKRLAPEERETGGWKYLESIRHTTEQMERLINDLLDVKRLEAGQMRLDRAPLDVAELVAEAVDVQEPVASARSIVLDALVPPGLPALSADRERLLQVFANLIGNAIKFTPDGGRVTVRARASGPSVVFAVEDTGSGIASEDLPRIFERYWQAARARRAGAGLGLAIVKGIVEAHGGRVWVESEVGRGTTFRFAIPHADGG